MAVFTGEAVTILTISMTLLVIAFYLTLNKIKEKRSKVSITDNKISENLKFGFYLSTSNIIMLIAVLYMVR